MTYLQALSDGRVVPYHTERTQGTVVEVAKVDRDRVTLKSVYGLYLTAHPNGTVLWDRPIADAWEYWTLIPEGGDTVRLRGHFAQYLCVKGGRVLTTPDNGNNRDTLFTLCKTSGSGYIPIRAPTPTPPPKVQSLNGKRFIKSTVVKRVLVPDIAGNVNVISGLPTATSKALAEFTEIGGNRVTIKSVYGQYLSAQPDGRVEWNRDVPKEWEWWTVTKGMGDQIHLRGYHGMYLTVERDGTVHARSRNIGLTQSFTLPLTKKPSPFTTIIC
jgi:hypothetical protein